VCVCYSGAQGRFQGEGPRGHGPLLARTEFIKKIYIVNKLSYDTHKYVDRVIEV
jgi:hypothetical protein